MLERSDRTRSGINTTKTTVSGSDELEKVPLYIPGDTPHLVTTGRLVAIAFKPLMSSASVGQERKV